MSKDILFLVLVSFTLWANPRTSGQTGHPGTFKQPDRTAFPNLYTWTDTCNVYVLRDGDAALLIDLGDGSVLDHLAEIGVSKVEWVLFTHHHREQCQGYPRLQGKDVKIGAPEAERALFEQPQNYRKMKVSLGDAFTIHSSSYVRPPLQPIPLNRTFKSMDTFVWRGHEIWCEDTRGNSPGAMSYLVKQNGQWAAFSGDLMMAGARMHNWFDSEWDYGFAAGIYALHSSAGLVAGFRPAWLLPSHGDPVRNPEKPLRDYQNKLLNLEKLLLRGYGASTFSGGYQDKVSRPSEVPQLWQVTPHLFKFRGPNFWPNFGLILSASGRGLVVDCGLLDEAFLDKALDGMREKYGLKAIDAVIITHMHGDHFLEAPHLKEKWGAQIWALDRMGPPCEHPERFDYAAPIQAYGKGFDAIKFDRLFKSGEKFQWEEYQFTVDWMPGQTEFALCLNGMIDGRKVAFTGDNLFGDPDDPRQTGHEAVVAHNSSVLEEGYIYGAHYLKQLRPDLLVGGHSYVMDHPAQFIDRFYQWSTAMRDAFKDILAGDDYRYGYDPFWVRAEPCRLKLAPGPSAEVTMHVRNFRKRPQNHRIVIHCPPGLSVEKSIWEGTVPPEGMGKYVVNVKADANAASGMRIVALDVTLDGHRYGEWFDFAVQIEK